MRRLRDALLDESVIGFRGARARVLAEHLERPKGGWRWRYELARVE